MRVRWMVWGVLLWAGTFCSATEHEAALLKTRQGQPVFVSGMNLAWIHFGRDLTDFNESEFARALNEISEAGGNTLRWWLHVNGSQSPRFDDGKVCGLNSSEIGNLKRALDLAFERRMLIIPVLWSFDLLQEQAGVDLTRNLNLIRDPEYTRAYIDKALTPLVLSVLDHPAVLCWEICNEPEGMSETYGWTPRRVSRRQIQQFHNLLAGALHRLDPETPVTTGSWNMLVLTDQHGFKNWYADSALVTAGGDPLGTLDFYQVHYYPRWYGEGHSPFHHPASYWGTDKPILIGEVQARGLVDLGDGFKLDAPMSTEAVYRNAHRLGYLGCLSWTWTGHDGHGNVHDAAPGMQVLRREIPALILIRPE